MNGEANPVWPRARQSQALSEWIQTNADGSTYPDVARLRLAVWSFHVGFEHHSAIGQLVLLNHPISAMALVRSLFEAMILGLWIIHCATDDQVARFQQGKFDPKLSAMLTSLRMHPVLKAEPLQAYLQGNGSRLHGWTHGGIEVLGSLAESDGIVNEADVGDLLITADGFALMIAQLLANGANNGVLGQGATERMIALRAEACARGL